jgi:O-antigen biosynthesis rhamnosyltransferase
MRVLHFYKTALPYSVGGIEHFIHQLSQSATEHGVESTVLSVGISLCEHKPINYGYKNYQAKRTFSISSNDISFQAINLFKKLVKEVDLVHYHYPWPFADFVHLISPPNKPTVLTYHSDIIRQKFLMHLYKPLQYKFLNAVDTIVATSQNYVDSSEVLRKYSSKTEVIPIGIDIETYPEINQDQAQYYRNLFGERFFLFLGVLRYYKGLNFLVEAARISPYPIVIAGSGEFEEELKSLIKKYRLTNVFMIGHVSNQSKSALLSACYCMIFPSHLRSEAFGISLLEGAMYGKPLISCDLSSGTSFININNETGLVIPPENISALSWAMTWMQDHPEEALNMGKRSKLRYEQYFTAKQMGRSYAELYKKLLTNPHS